MLKLRVMGTKEELRAYRKYLAQEQKAYKVRTLSELYPNKGTDRFYRMYAELIRTGRTKEE